MHKSVLALALFILCSSCGERFSLYPIPNADQNPIDTKKEVGRFLDKSLSENPDNVDIAIQKLRYLKEEGWVSDSRVFVDRYLEKDSLNQVLHELAADFYISRNMLGTALRQANAAEALGANSPDFYDMKAVLFSRLGKYKEAIDYINKAILLNRSDYSAYYTKGKIYLTLKDTLSALKFMETSLEYNRDDHELLYEISDIYEGKKDYTQAMQLIDRAIQEKPSMESLQIKKASIQLSSGAATEGKRTLKSTFHMNESHMESGYKLAKLYFDEGIYDSTILIANSLIGRDSIALEALLLKARSFNKKYFYNNAVQNYKMLLAIDSTNQEAREEMRKVNGKIAYLRKLKETRASMPVFDLVSPKKNN